MNNIDGIKEYFNSLPEVKRIHELEPYIDNSKKINDTFNELKSIQRKMVEAKEYKDLDNFELLKASYEKKKDELLDLPFVEEYLELIEIVGNMLHELTSSISDLIDKKLGE